MVTAVTAVNAGRWGDREVGHSRTAGCAQDSGAATNPRFSATPQPRLCARRPPTLSHHAYPRAARSVPAGPVHRLHRAARRPHPGAFLHLVRHRPRVDPPASPTASTQLGFAVQLGYARLPGRVLRVGEEAHPQIVATLASQLGVDPAMFATYLHGRDTTRREHQLELQRDFGFRSFSATTYRELACWLLQSPSAPTSGRFWSVRWSTSSANAKSWLRRCRRSSDWPGRRVVAPSGSCSSG